jgi:hypothetical protein
MASRNADFSDYQKFVPPPYEEPRHQHGCFFYGCIIASILSLLLLIAVGVAAFFIYRLVEGVVDNYTATTPNELPKVDLPAEQRRTLRERVDAFDAAIKEGRPTEPLVLTSEELNALIDEKSDLKGKIYVSIEKDRLKGQISFPLSEILNTGMTRGRYLNGEATLKASLEDGVLIVTIDSLQVNGMEPPPEVMNSVRSQNLAKGVYKDARNAEEIRNLESIQIKDGKLFITARDRSKQDVAEKSDDSPRIETGDGKVIVHPPGNAEKTTSPPDATGTPPAGIRPDDLHSPPDSRPTAPADPARKP